MHYASTYTSTCGGMRSRLALGGRRRGAGARVPSPRLLPRQVALLEEHVLPRGRDPRVLVLVEDDLRLRRRTGRLILVGAMYGASVAATAAASDSPRLVAVLPVPIDRSCACSCHSPGPSRIRFAIPLPHLPHRVELRTGGSRNVRPEQLSHAGRCFAVPSNRDQRILVWTRTRARFSSAAIGFIRATWGMVGFA